MGSPIGPLMGDITMNHIVQRALESTPNIHKRSLFCRYVDDCFATFQNSSSIDIFLNNFNSICKQIQFTKELESFNSLAFLDVLIERTDSKLKTSTYKNNTYRIIH